MPDDRLKTAEMNVRTKEVLFSQNHPLIREIRQIPGIIMDDGALTGKTNDLSLKELFLKQNMDTYHVDCLVLRKIARNVLAIMMKLGEIPIYPGLYALEDIYVNMSDSAYPVYMTCPEKFQLLSFEQDYEWYPEDERIFGDITLFDEDSQAVANQRFLYKMLTASSRGNVRIPPRASRQDYSNLFYGTLPETWREIFESGQTVGLDQWKDWLDEAISLEEGYERDIRENNMQIDQTAEIPAADSKPASMELRCLFVILRTECSNSLEISRMLYQAQDLLELEQSHGPVHLEEAFVYGDGVVQCKEFCQYAGHYRVQIPHHIREYDIVEALLVACEWLKSRREENLVLSQNKTRESCQDHVKENRKYRLYILSDGRVENNSMFRECLKKIARLMEAGVEVRLIRGRDASCEAFEQLETMISRG